jgi:hypothetical protein
MMDDYDISTYTPGERPFTSFTFMLTASILFVVSHVILEAQRPNFKWAHKLCQWNNIVYAFFSGFLFFWSLLTYLTPPASFLNPSASYSHLPPFTSSLPFYFYYLSKCWEFLDVYLVLLKEGGPIHIHFRIHHSTTLSLAWVAMTTESDYALWPCLTNTGMHFFLYLYFGGVAPYFWSVVRVLGFVQLFVGIGCSCLGIFNRYEEGGVLWGELYILFMYFTFLGLFVWEIFVFRPAQAQNLKDDRTKKAL